MIEDTITIKVIQDAQQKDRSALEELVRSYQPVLYYIAACHLKTEDHIQATVRKCLSNLLYLLNETEDLSTYAEKAMTMVIRICLNAALSEEKDHLSFLSNTASAEEQNAVYTAADETPVLISETEKQAMRHLVSLLQQLPDEQRMVFVTRYLDRYSFDIISKRIHVDQELLKKRAQLAKQKLSAVSGLSIPQLFGLVKLAETNKYLVLDDESALAVSQAAPELPAVSTDNAASAPSVSFPVKWKKLLYPAGIVAAAAGCVFLLRPTKTIDVLKNATCSFTGVNGAGSAELSLPVTENKKLNQILSETSCQLENNSGNTVVEGELSNGDVVTYSCAFDPSKLKKAHVNIPETSVSFTVEGLNDPAPINLFEDVILYGEADEESGAVYLYAEPRDKKFREVYYNVVSEDENGILVYADISDDLLLKYGLVAEDHYHTYPQSALPEDIQQLVREEIIRTSIGQAAASRDEYGREIANGSNADINALAQSFLGRGGACNEIANAFIYALYGVRVHTGYSLDNLYPVDTPEAGDLIYYYDTAGNYRHVATYIGNGLVLNGNYGDGTAHITSMYESWYANNPMTFLRVAH